MQRNSKEIKRIWFVSHYSMPPQYEKRVKTLKFAHYLNEWGYRIKIFSCSVMHDYDINLIEKNEKYIEKKYDDLEFVHINCARYGQNFTKRVINHLQFAYRFCKIAQNFELPDVIVATDLNCINYKPICKFCKKNGIKLVADIRDLWPLSFVWCLGFSESNPLIRMLYKREKKMYQLADAIVFSMEGGADYIKDKGWEQEINLNKIHHINNGIDLKEFYYNQKHYTMEDQDLQNPALFKVVYAGSIRQVNGLSMLVDTAEILYRKGYKDIKIIVFGEGDERPRLMNMAKEKGLENIIFKGSVEKKYIPCIVSQSDLNIAQVKETPLLKYGCSWNKLFDYFAAGKPILSTLKMNYDLIEKYHTGSSLKLQTPEAIAEAIVNFKNLPKDEYVQICKNAKAAAQDYDFFNLTKKLQEIIEVG